MLILIRGMPQITKDRRKQERQKEIANKEKGGNYVRTERKKKERKKERPTDRQAGRQIKHKNMPSAV